MTSSNRLKSVVSFGTERGILKTRNNGTFIKVFFVDILTKNTNLNPTD